MKFWRLLLVLILLSGCSTWVQVQKVPTTDTSSAMSKRHPCNGWNKQGWTPGVRYSLPATFLVVRPDPKKRGGYSIETKLFADHDQTYAIDACSFLASYTFNIELEEGLLKKVVLNQSSAEVPEAAVNAATEIAKAELEERKEERKKAEEAAEEKEQKLKTLQEAVAKATKELDLARADVAEWERLIRQMSNDVPKEFRTGLRTARLRLRAAEIDMQLANQALEEFLAGEGGNGAARTSSSDDTPVPADNPGGSPAEKPDEGTSELPAEEAEGADNGFGGAEAGGSPPNDRQNPAKPDPQPPTKAPAYQNDKLIKGPAFYKLEDTCDPWASNLGECHVRLVAVDWDTDRDGTQIQRPFPVTAVPKKDPPAKQPPKLADEQIWPAAAKVTFTEGVYERSLVLTKAICRVNARSSRLKEVVVVDQFGEPSLGDKNYLENVELNLLAGKGTIQLRIRKGDLPKEKKYKLDLKLHWDHCDKEEPISADETNIGFYFDIDQ